MKHLKESKVDLIGLGENSKLGIGKTENINIPTQAEAVASQPSTNMSPIEADLREMLGVELDGLGDATTKISTGLSLGKSDSLSNRARGIMLREEGLSGLDKQAKVKAIFEIAKQKNADRKQAMLENTAKVKAISDSFKERPQEINSGIGQAISFARQGRPDQAYKIIEDVANAATMKAGIKYVVTGFDPESLKIDGFTQEVDANGEKVGEAKLLQNETVQTLFQGVDISDSLGKAEALRQEAINKSNADTAGRENILGRDLTQQEREIQAGVAKPITRQETGGVGEFELEKSAKSASQKENISIIQSSEDLLGGIESIKRFLIENPNSIGGVGKLSTAFDALVEGYVAPITSIANNDFEKGLITPEILSNITNTGASALFTLETALAYNIAKSQNPDGKISNADFENARLQVNLTGVLATNTGVLRQLSVLESMTREKLNLARGRIEQPIGSNVSSPFLEAVKKAREKKKGSK